MGIFAGIKKAIDEKVNYSGSSFFSTYYGSIFSKSKTGLIDEYKNLVYACVNVIAEEVGKYEPIFTIDEKPINHQFGKVLNRPNERVSKFDLMFASQAYLELTGELYWYLPKGEITKKIKEIYILRPDRVEHIITDGKLTGYKYSRGDGNFTNFTLDEVEAYYQFNPLNEFVGYSTTQAGNLYIEGENVSSEFQTNFIKNQATPSGIISIKNKVSRELFDKIGKQWKREHSGSRNAGKTVFLNGGDIEFTKMGLSISDLNLKELKEVTEKKVMQMFRVPSALLGETDSAGLGRANIETIEYIFAKRTIEPKLVRFDDFIERIIRKHYKENVSISHESLVPQDMEFKLKLMESGKDIWLTRNEIRKLSQLELEPIEGGDQLFKDGTKVLLTEIPEPVVKTFKAKIVKKEVNDDMFTKLDKLEDKEALKIEKALRKIVKEQEKIVLSKVPLLGKKIKAFEEFLIDLDEMTPEMVLQIFPKIIEAIEASGEVVISFTGGADVEFLISQAQRDAIFNSTERLMKGFNKETVEKMQKQLAGGLMNNETQAELTKRIESVFEEAKGYRAERIARTETHRAMNEGVSMAYQQQGFKKMKWVAWGDACPFCKSLDGKETSIGVPFVAKGDSLKVGDAEFLADYDAVRYADLHPNCRCKIEPV